MKKTLISFLLSTVLLFPVVVKAEIDPPASEIKKMDFKSVMVKRKKEKEEMEYKQVVSFYPIKAISNYMMLGYERQISPKHALKVVAGYVNFETNNTSTNFNFDVKDFSGLRFDLMLKYFIGNNNPVFNGVYFSPFLSFKNSKFKYHGFTDFNNGPVWEEGSASSTTVGFLFGYQLPLGDSFSIDLYVGDALKKSSGNYLEADRLMDPYKNSISIISGFCVGFGF